MTCHDSNGAILFGSFFSSPVIGMSLVKYPGNFSKVRAMPQAGHIVASWADTGKLHMFGCQNFGGSSQLISGQDHPHEKKGHLGNRTATN